MVAALRSFIYSRIHMLKETLEPIKREPQILEEAEANQASLIDMPVMPLGLSTAAGGISIVRMGIWGMSGAGLRDRGRTPQNMSPKNRGSGSGVCGRTGPTRGLFDQLLRPPALGRLLLAPRRRWRPYFRWASAAAREARLGVADGQADLRLRVPRPLRDLILGETAVEEEDAGSCAFFLGELVRRNPLGTSRTPALRFGGHGGMRKK